MKAYRVNSREQVSPAEFYRLAQAQELMLAQQEGYAPRVDEDGLPIPSERALSRMEEQYVVVDDG